jgi:hypothetical protein
MSAPPRFSEDELVDIIIGTRMRSAVHRDTGPEHDRIDILIPHMPGCSYRFERDRSGWTYLLHTSRDECKLISVGTLPECLGILGSRQV